ncbi:MAG: NPCBM/NEW2 domain-containing protein [Pirellulales bacterium]
MSVPRSLALFLTTPLLLAAAQTICAADGRYLAVFASGERLEGNRIASWHVPDSTPMLDSISLRDDKRNLRWLRDRSLYLRQPTASAAASIEFIGGDRLPGKVVAFVAAAADGTPAHLLVQTNQNIGHPTDEPKQRVRVDLDFVSGINWDRTSPAFDAPGTILLGDGRRVFYREITWSDDSARVLTDRGIERFAFAAISQLRLPAKDFWKTYYRELATLSPHLSARLLKLETASGITATASESRFDAVVTGLAEKRQHIEATITRLQQRQRDFVARQKTEQTKLDQKLREYQRKRDQQLRKLQSDLRNMRNRMKKSPADEVDRKVKEFDERTRKRIEEQFARLTKNYKAIVARNIQRHQDSARNLDRQIKQVEQQGGIGPNAQGKPEQWFHMVQPAWSLDPLWIRFNSIRTRWSFAPNELPLSRLKPVRITQQSVLGKTWSWQTNRNIRGGALRNTGIEYGWGFGVHATNELHFAVPSFVTSFRSLIGLDDVAGGGGCIRAEVYVNTENSSRRLYQSEFLVGSQSVLDTGRLNLGQAGLRQKRLVLTIHAANQDRPAGADPLDIRDHADWLEPILELNPIALQTAIQKYVQQ